MSRSGMAVGPGAILALVALAFLAGASLRAGPPKDDAQKTLLPVAYHGHTYETYTADPEQHDIRIFYKDDTGKLLRDFPAVADYVKGRHARIYFAANAGMFQPDLTPVGLLLLNANPNFPLNLNDGQGNFYMKPNGVFVVNQKDEARIVESSEFSALLTPSVWATQSGPLLVQAGDIPPDFNADSKSVKIRSGVGVRKDGKVVFALSADPVNFYEFALLFLNRLKCPDALYLDGDISAFWVPGMKDQPPHSFGPILGVADGLD
jgi:uncharacterized protein YigE (DUF2233 family)